MQISRRNFVKTGVSTLALPFLPNPKSNEYNPVLLFDFSGRNNALARKFYSSLSDNQADLRMHPSIVLNPELVTECPGTNFESGYNTITWPYHETPRQQAQAPSIILKNKPSKLGPQKPRAIENLGLVLLRRSPISSAVS